MVGSGITLSKDGDVFATGVTTSTTFSGAFSGSGANITGIEFSTINNVSIDYTTSTITNKPTIPTNNNTLTNGAGYITSVSGNITQLSNNAGYVTSSGVTSVATGNGCTGGTITSLSLIHISEPTRPY